MLNRFKTLFLMVALTAILLFIGGAVGGSGGIVIAFIFSLAMNFFSYWYSDKLVLKFYKAREITEIENPTLYSTVRRLATRASLPMPKVYIIPESSPNAFATGRNPSKSAVAFTEGILALLSQDEIEGVIAHELAHVKNRDTLIGTIVAAIAGAIMTIASIARWTAIFGIGGSDDENSNIFVFLATIIIAPIAAMLVQMAISRSREFLADSTGAEIAGNKYGLINGLKKIHSAVQTRPMQRATGQTAHLMIANPFSSSKIFNLFSTHPTLESRIKNLMN